MQQKVQRIKVKSTAKGDEKLPRDQRFALQIKFDDAIMPKQKP